ncbi:MAG TPA: CPXCG motif-containing cysteine-rich protein [Burkholderiales bacterium]
MRGGESSDAALEFGRLLSGQHTSVMLNWRAVQCPYCGEAFDTGIDTSAGGQTYTEDCYVCCRPIVFRIAADADGNLTTVETRREED